MAWRWTARRVGISAFVIFHLSALIFWTMPNCAIKERFQSPYRFYVLPLGIWQWWAIFAPDPPRCTNVLDAEVIDAKGMRHVYEFPRIADLPWWQKIPRYRNPKFNCNMGSEEYAKHREFTARHAVRQLGLGAEVFPVWVSLYLELKDAPPPGIGVADPMAPSRIQVLDRFQFASLKEVRP
ncbi:MAG TPA: hypothetical protein VFF52_14475 [Isosphaeraceae bacterium]|nr:hypothetical protein [Isosphaeraceae bacterium]